MTSTSLEPDENELAAEEAGLNYVSDAEPGFRRRRRGRGFSYEGDHGTIRKADTLARIRALAVPPAWTDVWICRDSLGHLQATGRDAKGRKQYRYHSRWREVRDANKFDLLASFGDALPALRDRVGAELQQPGLGRDKVLALVVHLLDETLIRVGNREYANDNESYGLTTITPDHVELGGRATTFDFIGKGGVEHRVKVNDVRIARIVRRCHELGGQALFSYRADDGDAVSSVTSQDVNEYLRDVAGASITAKDFRTWGGTTTAAEHLGPLETPSTADEADEHVVDAIDAAALQLRNTRAVCRSCYVHPAVLDAYREGSLALQWNKARSAGQLSRGERTVLSLL